MAEPGSWQIAPTLLLTRGFAPPRRNVTSTPAVGRLPDGPSRPNHPSGRWTGQEVVRPGRRVPPRVSHPGRRRRFPGETSGTAARAAAPRARVGETRPPRLAG